jgi:hypothetical protein
MIKRLLSLNKRNKRGQSFIELMLVTLLLALMLAGVVEFGFLMNNYLHVVDAAREAARYANSYVAFDSDRLTIDTFYYDAVLQATVTMAPITLDPTLGDDIIVSVISIRGTEIVRFPIEDPQGWSLCGHFAAAKAFYLSGGHGLPDGMLSEGWDHCAAQPSRITDADISARVGSSAQQAGMLLVEILYNYPQMLKIPIFTNGEFFGTRFSIIPDPIPLYVYSIMPISSAEPTPDH